MIVHRAPAQRFILLVCNDIYLHWHCYSYMNIMGHEVKPHMLDKLANQWYNFMISIKYFI